MITVTSLTGHCQAIICQPGIFIKGTVWSTVTLVGIANILSILIHLGSTPGLNYLFYSSIQNFTATNLRVSVHSGATINFFSSESEGKYAGLVNTRSTEICQHYEVIHHVSCLFFLVNLVVVQLLKSLSSRYLSS